MVFLQPFLELHTMKLTRHFRNFEKWALVTGAASGMGRIYVSRLAGMGYNVVAVDINAEYMGGRFDCVCRNAENGNRHSRG